MAGCTAGTETGADSHKQTGANQTGWNLGLEFAMPLGGFRAADPWSAAT